MSFDLELLKEELSKYGTIIECSLNNDDANLEIKCKNSTGRLVTYQRIENDFILPYYPIVIKTDFREGYYKSAFSK